MIKTLTKQMALSSQSLQVIKRVGFALMMFVLWYGITVTTLMAQPTKQWDKTIGGSYKDYLYSVKQTTDGGYILGGASASNASGTKSENSRGYFDYWVVKLNAAGVKEWDKTLGGSDEEDFNTIHQTKDGGYIVSGTSRSDASGDKSENNTGFYGNGLWIVKLDAAGNKEWDKTYSDDYRGKSLHILEQTTDGYILGGSYFSSERRGDYWIVKINSSGVILWDKSLGGPDDDRLASLQQTADGGYILGGESFSNAGGDKSENLRGSWDYWVVKVNASGNKEWDKTLGGTGFDYFSTLQQTTDGGFIVGGYSGSTAGGDKSENPKGGNAIDFWVIKLNAAGVKQWDKTIGGSSHDALFVLQQTKDGGYILGGRSSSDASSDKSENSKGLDDYWIVKLNGAGNKEWDKTIGGSGDEDCKSLQQTEDGGFILGGTSSSDISGDKSENEYTKGGGDYWVVKLSASPTTERTIKTANFLPTGFCADFYEKFSVHFTTTGSFGSNETFIVQLSDENGSFISPVNIGSGSQTPLSAVIPSDSRPGTGYRIRVVSSLSPVVIGADNGSDLGVSNGIVLGQPFFYGPNEPCPGTVAVYKVSHLGDYRNYKWVVPNGWTIVSGQGTDSLAVTVGTNQGYITLSVDSYCSTHTRDEPVKPSVLPTKLTAITTNNTPCAGESVVYTVKPADQNYNYDNGYYNWQLPSGWTIISGQWTNSITVKAGSAPGTISVNFQNSCGSSPTQTLAVASNIINPPVVTSKAICGPGPVTLTAAGAPATGSYRWYTSNSGSTPVATTSIFTTPVLSTTTTYYVSVVNGTCESARVPVTATVNPLPKVLVTTNATTITSGGAATLTASGASAYTWSPATGLSSTTGASVIAKPTATTTYTVTGTDVNGCTSTANIIITVNTSGLQMQTITFPPIPDKVYGDAPFTLNATASSGLSLYYRIMSGLATISGRTLTITGVGKVTVRAYHPGNDRYLAATPVDVSFNVLSSTVKQSQTISFASLSNKEYGDAPFTLSATASSGLPVSFSILSGPATISGNIITLTGAGTVTVRATQAGSGTYHTAQPVDQSFTVAKVSQIITFAGLPDRTYGAGPIYLTAKSSSGLPVSFRVTLGPASVSGNILTITGAGTVTVLAEQNGDINYSAATSVPSSFVVSKANQTVTLAAIPDKTYGEPPFTLSATASSGLPITYSIVSGPANISNNVVTLTGVGTITVRASQAGNTNYNAASTDKSFAVKSAETVPIACSLALTSKVTQAEPWFGMWGPTTGAGAIDLTVSGGTAPFAYKWSNGLTVQDVAVAASGTYTVTVTDAKGCTAKTIVTVGRKNDPIKLAVSQINVSTTGGWDGSIDLSVVGGIAPFTYRWSNGATTEDLTNLAAGTYTVKVTDAFGQKVSTSVQILAPEQGVLAAVKKQTLGEEFIVKENTLLVYPNPATDQAIVKFTLATTGHYTLELFDIRGAKIKTIVAGQASANKVLDIKLKVDELAEGIYLLKLVTNKGVDIQRVSVKR